MIEALHGKIERALPTQVAINVHGVTFLLLIPLSTYDQLPAEGKEVRILAHLNVREDAMVLYGFMSEEERDLFRLLIHHVTGIGPKLALSVLSGMPVSRFKAAISEGDTTSLAKVKGLGKKTAERITLELKDKLGVAAAWEAASQKHAQTPQDKESADAVLALIALGYKQSDSVQAVQQAAKKLVENEENLKTEDLLREALRKLA